MKPNWWEKIALNLLTYLDILSCTIISKILLKSWRLEIDRCFFRSLRQPDSKIAVTLAVLRKSRNTPELCRLDKKAQLVIRQEHIIYLSKMELRLWRLFFIFILYNAFSTSDSIIGKCTKEFPTLFTNRKDESFTCIRSCKLFGTSQKYCLNTRKYQRDYSRFGHYNLHLRLCFIMQVGFLMRDLKQSDVKEFWKSCSSRGRGGEQLLIYMLQRICETSDFTY